ncbi:MAG: FecR domain-containing protein [Spirochaetales bacterium]|nr:FecR domain-containing protein [Spirochaetales bacterium]
MSLSKRDIFFTLIILTLISLLSFLLWKGLTQTEILQRKDALGTIVFRKRSATRRSPSSLNWERLQNHSPVYNQDTIRTADLSEAELYFEDGSVLGLFENTMVKLNFEDKSQSLYEFTEGRLTLSGGEGKTLIAGDHSISFSGDTTVSLSGDKEMISINVDRGEAILEAPDGNQSQITPFEEVEIDKASGSSQSISRSVDLQLPAANARLISQGTTTPEVLFHWESKEASSELTLQLSTSPQFSDPRYFSVEEDSLSLPLEEGIYYWKITKNREDISSTSRFTLKREDELRLIQPAPEEVISYRNTLPSVDFSWNNLENASSYHLEISSVEDFSQNQISTKTTLTSLSLPLPAEGLWYWRVTPQFTQEFCGAAPDYPEQSLTLRASEEMKSPVQNYPLDQTLYDLKVMDNQGITLSWNRLDEADHYELGFSHEPSLDSLHSTFSTEETFIKLNGKIAPLLAEAGEHYWAVRWIDNENNTSPWSASRRLEGVDTTQALRLVSPPDGYRISDSLINNIRFTWKTNIPSRKVYQLSEDRDFQTIEYEEEVQAETLLGKNWPVGKWYWRIRTFNADGTVFVDTEPSAIDIVPPLPEPVLLAPQPGLVHIYQEGQLQTISWQESEGADYYNLKMFPVGSRESVYEQGLLETTEVTLSFDDIPDGDYIIQLQGFARETEQSTRIIGYMSSTPLSIYQLRPAELVYPVNNPTFKGLTALRSGIDLLWSAADTPESAEIRVYSASSGRRVFTASNPGEVTNIPNLPAGKYYWTVKGTLRGFDISAKGYGYFTVASIPLLPVPRVISPEDNYVIDTERLRTSRSLLFDWEPVEGATHYELEILSKESGKTLVSSGLIKQTQFELEDLALLDKGEFEWTLRCEHRNSRGIREQSGRTGSFNFTIDLPTLNDLKLKTDEVYYGY